jgi:hypothetical protein
MADQQAKPHQLTKLDEQLREMAILNWQQFVTLIGAEAITKAKVCMLRGAGDSYGAVAYKLGMNKNQARHKCKPCQNPNQ